MAKRRASDDWWEAEVRQRVRDALPAGVTLAEVGELCISTTPPEAGYGCANGVHTPALAARRLTQGEFPAVAPEVLAWLADLGGVCDCTIGTTALDRVVELSGDAGEDGE